IYSIMLLLAVLAPEISGWPLFVLLPISSVLSVTGLRFAKTFGSGASRWIALVVNGRALTFDLLIILGLATMFFGRTKERFLIPNGYKGDVYVVHGARDGESLNRTRWRVTYRIPEDGVLQTREPMLGGWTRSEYYYERQDGSLERIRNFWPTTIHPTPE